MLEASNIAHDAELVKTVMRLFQAGDTLNLMDFLLGVIMIHHGDLEEKASLLFDAFDFQSRGEMGVDELLIMILAAGQTQQLQYVCSVNIYSSWCFVLARKEPCGLGYR